MGMQEQSCLQPPSQLPCASLLGSACLTSDSGSCGVLGCSFSSGQFSQGQLLRGKEAELDFCGRMKQALVTQMERKES